MPAIVLWRAGVFLLALFYSANQFIITDLGAFGWQFRYLTVWALTFNTIVAAQMLRLSLGRTSRDLNSFVSLAVILSLTVVVQYWRLYFDDPAKVNGSGHGNVWWREYYLHLLGPLLLWIDAFLILRVFRHPWRVAGLVLLLGLAYPVWVELAVGPMNDAPAGTVTSGLPYPFLNDLDVAGRAAFYATVTAANMIFLGIAFGMSRLIGWRFTGPSPTSGTA